MSNIYISEPPTNGKVLLVTTVGDIDIELWSKEAPKACRNFVQLCMEGYYDDTIFHRLVRNFICQGGDPTGTGTGGESIYGQPFKDEVHSRLRFNRRGLVAMANAGKNDNGSQFFFTLGEARELQGKHTIFGKVAGNTIYNMIKLSDSETDKHEKPLFPHKIIKTRILYNPFNDIVPREKKVKHEDEKKRKQSGSKATKNFTLLSFGDEAEEDEEEVNDITEKLRGPSKSSHDLTDDPVLSSTPAIRDKSKSKKSKRQSQDQASSEEAPDIKKSKPEIESPKKESPKKELKPIEEEEKEISKSDELKKESEQLMKEIKESRKAKENPPKEEIKEEPKEPENASFAAFLKEQEKYKELKKLKKGSSREEQTLAILAKFKSKLHKVVSEEKEEEEKTGEEDQNEEAIHGDSWMNHTLSFEEHNRKVLDANVAEFERYDVFDPRNPIVKRRRETSKQAMKDGKR